MSIKTVRFNKEEDDQLKKVVKHYGVDFSACIKSLIAEKAEDLEDLKFIKSVKEDKPSAYVSAKEIDAALRKRAS